MDRAELLFLLALPLNLKYVREFYIIPGYQVPRTAQNYFCGLSSMGNIFPGLRPGS
jgi:hypothetical protein